MAPRYANEGLRTGNLARPRKKVRRGAAECQVTETSPFVHSLATTVITGKSSAPRWSESVGRAYISALHYQATGRCS